MDKQKIVEQLLKLAKEITSARQPLWGFKDDVELGYDPFSSTIEIGMGGEWWGGKVKEGKNVYHHRKEKIDEAYKPVTLYVRRKGHALAFDVMGGFGFETTIILEMK